MSHLIIAPLKEDYEVIRISVTGLEAFLKCAKKHNEVPFQKSEALDFGIKAHEMLGNYMFNKNHYNYIFEEYVENEEDKLHKKLLGEYIDLATEHIPEIYKGEDKMVFTIECGPYLVELVGKYDGLHEDGSIIDFKTSQYARPAGEEKYKLQPRLYTAMYYLMKGEEMKTVNFHFYIFTKHKKKPAQLDTRTVQVELVDAKEKMIKLVKQYVVAYHTKTRMPKKNLYCKGCELFKTNMCELHNPLLLNNVDESTNQD